MLPGEGACVFLLNAEDAQRDGDPIHAVIHGVAAAHDDPTHALALATQRSLRQAQSRSEDLAVVMTDASGLPSTDEQIARAVLTTRIEANRDRPLWMGSVVGQIGHTGGASAAASLLTASLAVEHGVVPGTFGLRSPLATILRAGELVKCGNRAKSIRPATADRLLTGMVLSQDGGLAYSAVIEQVKPVTLAGGPSARAAAESAGDKPTVVLESPRPTVAHRSTLQSIEEPLPAGCSDVFYPPGAVLILGENRTAQLLHRLLEDQGAFDVCR